MPTAYAGTLIMQGQAVARVTATGERSEIGRIGTALGLVVSERSPLQKQPFRVVRNLALLALALSLALVLVYGLMKADWLQALLAGIALAMAMLPEEYPVVLTVFPALGARRLSAEGVLTRRINAIETLGATTVLCSDKTGTLTENRMTVTHLAAGGVDLEDRLALDTVTEGQLPEAFHPLVEVAILASVVDPFATLVVGNLALILSNRSATRPLWASLRIPNQTLWVVLSLAFAMLLAALYVPWAIDVLRFAPLPAHELAAACGVGLLSVLWFEGIKWAQRRGAKRYGPGGAGEAAATQGQT